MDAQTKGPTSANWTAPKSNTNYRPHITETAAIAQFRAAMRAAGIEPPELIEPTGDKLRRFSTNGRARDDGGWYVLYLDGLPAGAFGDWRAGTHHVWHADIGRALTPTEEQAHRARLAAMKAAREAEDAKRRAKAADLTRALLAAGQPATTANPHLLRKGITAAPRGAMVLEAGKVAAILNYAPQAKGAALVGELLILPITRDGELTGAELIDGEGRKAAVAGTAKAGACWLPEPIPTGAKVIAVGEGAATILSAAEATGWPVLAALAAGNLEALARGVRRDHPGAAIIILADLTKDTREPDPRAIKAAAAVGGRLAVPELSSEAGTDWNDHAAVHGLAATQSALLSILAQAPPDPPAVTKAGALREAVRLADDLNDPLARALYLADVGKVHLGKSAPDAAASFIEQAERATRRTFPLPPANLAYLAATEAERAAARLAPRCIVSSCLYADVALKSAAGGTGKTTEELWEAIHLITGRPLFGLTVEAPGPVVFVTAEDPRGVLLARLHRLMAAMDPPLTPAETAAIDTGFIAWDVSGDLSRLVDIDTAGRLMPTGFADAVITAAAPLRPALIVLDPIVSFGPGESRINDIEQALIVEARRIVRALDCAVKFITHVSQNAARAGTLDQYASRGGTALADGARMVSVLAPWKPGDSDDPPITLEMPTGASVLKLARPKLTYCQPLPLVWLARDGYRFTWALAAPPLTPESQLAADADQLERFLISELADHRRYTRATLEQARPRMGMSRDPLRRALAELEVARRVIEEPLPAEERIGGRKTYLRPATNSRPASAR